MAQTLQQLEALGRVDARDWACRVIAGFPHEAAIFILRGAVRGLAGALGVMVGSRDTAEFLFQLADDEIERGALPADRDKVLSEIERVTKGASR